MIGLAVSEPVAVPTTCSAPICQAPGNLGESNQVPTVKKMNEDEKQKVDTTGK
jgi:hypothetical protein